MVKRRQANISRQEKATKKNNYAQKKLDLVEFRVEGDDIKIISGDYAGKTVKEIWDKGVTERDWVANKIWVRYDQEANAIISRLACR